MSKEYRPACPTCRRALVYQPAGKRYWCSTCRSAYEKQEVANAEQVEIEVFP